MACDRDNRRELQAEAAAAVIRLGELAGAASRALLRTDGGPRFLPELARELAEAEADREAEATGDRIGCLFNAAICLDGVTPAEIRAYVSAHRARPEALGTAIRVMLNAYRVAEDEMRSAERRI